MSLSSRFVRDRRLTAALLLLLVPACATAKRATDAAATATATTLAKATTATTGFVTQLLPFSKPSGPAGQAAQMREQAGPDKFRNDSFSESRDGMRVQHEEFSETRSGFVSNDFVQARARFRNGKTSPHSGPVLGPTTDPATIRAILLAAAAVPGVAPTPIQPVLAQLLPAFGN